MHERIFAGEQKHIKGRGGGNAKSSSNRRFLTNRDSAFRGNRQVLLSVKVGWGEL